MCYLESMSRRLSYISIQVKIKLYTYFLLAISLLFHCFYNSTLKKYILQYVTNLFFYKHTLFPVVFKKL